MGSRERILGRGAGRLLREVRREALVEQFDRDVEDATERLDEPLRLGGLLAARAAQRQRQADDDALDLLLAREPRQLRKPAVLARTLNDADRSRDRAGRIRDGDTRARRPVVERK